MLDDADIDAAVNAAAFGAFMNQGQICMSTERIVVDEKVADEFVEKLSAKAAGLPRASIRRSARRCLGSMVDGKSAARVPELIEMRWRRARVTAGGGGTRHAHAGDGARSRDASDADLCGGVVWTRGHSGEGEGR